MVKDNERTLNDSPNIVDKPYEPCKIEVIKLNNDVIMTSPAYSTNGTYDSLNGWDIFGG